MVSWRRLDGHVVLDGRDVIELLELIDRGVVRRLILSRHLPTWERSCVGGQTYPSAWADARADGLMRGATGGRYVYLDVGERRVDQNTRALDARSLQPRLPRRVAHAMREAHGASVPSGLAF